MDIDATRQNISSAIDEARWQDRLSRLPQKEKIKELAQEFESIFTEILLKSMRDTVPKSKLIDGGNAESIYQSMLDREYAVNMAKSGTNGLALQIEQQLLNALDAQQKVEGKAQYLHSTQKR